MITKLKLLSQIKGMRSLLLPVYVPALSFLIFVWLVTKITKTNAYFLTADPAEIGNQLPYAGLVSNIGLVLWSASLAICWFSAEVIKRDIKKANKWQIFFFHSGIITAMLLFDDMLQLHEQSHTYMPALEKDTAELIVFAIYGIIILNYFVKFRNIFLETDFLIFILALGFFVFSLTIDMNPEKIKLAESNRSILLEEGAKFLGITTWFIYVSRTCMSRLSCNSEQQMTTVYPSKSTSSR